MAKAKIVTKPPVPVKLEQEVHLELSLEEAEFLTQLVGSVSGASDGVLTLSRTIYWALIDTSVKPSKWRITTLGNS